MPESRRRLVHWLLGGGFSASLVSFLYPVIRFMNPPDVAEATVNEASVGNVQDFDVNAGNSVKFGAKPVLLIRTGEADWRAFWGTCTHLDCTVQYQDSSRQIWCACHNGFYDLNGNVVSGPTPRPLEELTVHIRDDEVIISRRA